jgi:protein required for attachment to host cells
MSKYSAARDLDLTTQVTWYVLANRTGAVIYRDSPERHFQFVERLTNLTGKIQEMELDSDRPGRAFSSAPGGQVRHSLDRRNNRHEASARRFASQIGNVLEAAYREERFNELVLVAEPHFLGLLRAALSDGVRNVVAHEVAREYTQGSDDELRGQVLTAIGR